jgi:hypothetical protein
MFVWEFRCHCMHVLDVIVCMSLQVCVYQWFVSLTPRCCDAPVSIIKTVKTKCLWFPPTCLFKTRCFPFQYFNMPRACRVLTISFALMAVSWLTSEMKNTACLTKTFLKITKVYIYKGTEKKILSKNISYSTLYTRIIFLWMEFFFLVL